MIVWVVSLEYVDARHLQLCLGQFLVGIGGADGALEVRHRQQSDVDGVGRWQQEHCDTIELLCELDTSAEGKDISCEVTIDGFGVDSNFVLGNDKD